MGSRVMSIPYSRHRAWIPGKRSRTNSAVAVGDVEENVVVASALHLRVDRLCHHVAWGEAPQGVIPLHERLAGAETEHASLSAHRLADQEVLRERMVQAGRVELHELHVGHHGPGAIRHGHPVARCDVGVRGVEVRLARPPRRQTHDAGGEGLHAAGRFEHVGAEAPLPAGGRGALHQEVHGVVVLEEGDVAVLLGALEQPALHLLARHVPGVEDAPVAVPPLPAEVEAVPGAAESNPPAHQSVDLAGTVEDDPLDHAGVAQAGTGLQRVPDVGGEGVVGPHDAGDAALRVVGARLAPLLLRDDGHGAAVRDLEGEGEARDAAAEDQEVEGLRQGAFPGVSSGRGEALRSRGRRGRGHGTLLQAKNGCQAGA